MGTLYNELQKWLKSPVKPKNQILQSEGLDEGKWKSKPKAKEVGPKEQRNAPSVKGSTSVPVINWIPPRWLEPKLWQLEPYLVGQYAIDVATLANLPVQSLAYKTGHSPLLLPWALRYSPEQAYLDLGKLTPWEK